jgi:hypothetical protein
MAQDKPQGTQIFSKQAYAISGGAILSILNILKDEIPARHVGTIQKVEDLLASVVPITLEEPKAPPAPQAPITPAFQENT